MPSPASPTSSDSSKEHVDARIDRRVYAVSEAGQSRAVPLRIVNDSDCDVFERETIAARALQSVRDQLHAAGAGPAVLVADREDAGGDGGGQ